MILLIHTGCPSPVAGTRGDVWRSSVRGEPRQVSSRSHWRRTQLTHEKGGGFCTFIHFCPALATFPKATSDSISTVPLPLVTAVTIVTHSSIMQLGGRDWPGHTQKCKRFHCAQLSSFDYHKRQHVVTWTH